MIKKWFTREVKVGLLVIASIFILFFGFNFLKGIDIFESTNSYYATFEHIDGLVKSSPVNIKGYKVGQVEEVKYDFGKANAFVIKISIAKDIMLPVGSIIELYDDGLMGGKAIRLVGENNGFTNQNGFYQSGDTLPSQIAVGLMGMLEKELLPKIEDIALQADSALRSLRSIMESESLNNSLASIETTTANLARSSSQLTRLMTNDVPRILGDVNVLTSDLKQMSQNLKNIDFAMTFDSINHTISNLNLLTDNLNNGEGSLGLLLNDKSLYINLSNTASSANTLLVDLQSNPKRYVNFSLFGRK